MKARVKKITFLRIQFCNKMLEPNLGSTKSVESFRLQNNSKGLMEKSTDF